MMRTDVRDILSDVVLHLHDVDGYTLISSSHVVHDLGSNKVVEHSYLATNGTDQHS